MPGSRSPLLHAIVVVERLEVADEDDRVIQALHISLNYRCLWVESVQLAEVDWLYIRIYKGHSVRIALVVLVDNVGSR